jgi:hypothetical protein
MAGIEEIVGYTTGEHHIKVSLLSYLSVIVLCSLPLVLVAGSWGVAFIERRLSLLFLFFIL